MKELHLYNVDQSDNVFIHALDKQLTVTSAATEVFNDFEQHEPLKVNGDVKAYDALILMKRADAEMKLVVSNQGDFLGLISSNELNEQNIISEVSRGVSRDDVLVKDLMLSKHKLHAFDYGELLRANVSDVVSSLRNYGLRHCLVVERNQHQIRGVISANDIARTLQVPLSLNERSSFGHLYNAITNQ